jgi:hypothetical protein
MSDLDRLRSDLAAFAAAIGLPVAIGSPLLAGSVLDESALVGRTLRRVVPRESVREVT